MRAERRTALDRGIDSRRAAVHSPLAGGRPPVQSADMRLDPNTHAFVLGTALLTSITFTIFALNLIALILQRVLY